MGKSMTNCATQAKEKARQQRQTDKAAKRMLARRKKTYAKTSVPTAHSGLAKPVLTGDRIESAD